MPACPRSGGKRCAEPLATLEGRMLRRYDDLQKDIPSGFSVGVRNRRTSVAKRLAGRRVVGERAEACAEHDVAA